MAYHRVSLSSTPHLVTLPSTHCQALCWSLSQQGTHVGRVLAERVVPVLAPVWAQGMQGPWPGKGHRLGLRRRRVGLNGAEAGIQCVLGVGSYSCSGIPNGKGVIRGKWIDGRQR